MPIRKANSDLSFLNGMFTTIHELLACCTAEDCTMNQILEYMSNFEISKDSEVQLIYRKANITKDRVFTVNQLKDFLDSVPKDWEDYVFKNVKEEILEKVKKSFEIVPRVLEELIKANSNDDIITSFMKQDIYVQQLLSYESGRKFGCEFIRRTCQKYENEYSIRFNSKMLKELKGFRNLMFNLIK